MPGKKKTTIQDIADALGITPSAVSKALNDHPRISDRTKKAVIEKAKQLNYQPNFLASALRSGKSKLLGVIVPAIDYAFFSSVVHGIEAVATKAGYNIIISQSNDSYEEEIASVNALIKTQADGVLASISNTTTSFEHFQRLLDNDIPLVLFDRISEQQQVSTVVIDDFQGAFHAVEHLIQQGCRRILHLAGYQRISLYQHRIAGYRAALQRYGLPFNERLIIESNLSLADGERIMRTQLRQAPLPEGIFAAGDHAALGAMHVLQEAGIAVPEQVAIIGFSNEPFTAFIRPALSTVDQQSIKIGELAAQLFLEQIAKKREPFTPRHEVLQPQLVIRQSSLRRATEARHPQAGG